MENGVAYAYSLDKLQDRGRFFISPTQTIYCGQVIGEHSRANDLTINVTKNDTAASAAHNILDLTTDELHDKISKPPTTNLNSDSKWWEEPRTSEGFIDLLWATALDIFSIKLLFL